MSSASAAAAAAAEGLKRFKHGGEGDGPASGQRWLVCIDGSAKAKAALQWTINTMKHDEDFLMILAVVELVVHSIPSPSDYFKQLEEHMNKHSKEHAEKLLEEAKAAAAGIKRVEIVLLESKTPKEAICKFVETNKVDNLVLGRRGMSEAERHLMGSTSEYCIRHAYANVIVIK